MHTCETQRNIILCSNLVKHYKFFLVNIQEVDVDMG